MHIVYYYHRPLLVVVVVESSVAMYNRRNVKSRILAVQQTVDLCIIL
jgi:hypothetical protein